MSELLNDDIVAAAVHLAERCGATDFEMGTARDHGPVKDAGWWATVRFDGMRVAVEDQGSPTAAALLLSQRLLAGATCRCGQIVTLSGMVDGCRWRLMGDRWQSGCDAPPITVPAGTHPGDYAGIIAAARAQLPRRTKP